LSDTYYPRLSTSGTTTTLAVVALPAGTPTRIAAASARRSSLAVANIGTGLASLGFASTVTAGNGWPLAAASASGDQGGAYEWPTAAIHTGEVWAVSAAGTAVAVMEG